MKTEAQPVLGLGTIPETGLAYISVILLLLSTWDNAIVGLLAKLIWIISFCVLCFINLGAGLGIYIFSVALYNPKHVLSPGPLWERIDNLALVIILAAFLAFFVRRTKLLESRKILVLMSVFLFTPLLQAAINGNLDWFTFAEYLRMFGLPFGMFMLVKSSNIARREIVSFFKVVMILGIYMAVVAILEKLNLYAYIMPWWIGDPNINGTIGTGRSGGPLMQSEFSGLALGLIMSIYWCSVFFDKAGLLLIKYMGMVLCMIGIYLSYTRAAWLSVIIAVVLLVFAKADVKTGLYKKVFFICLFLVLIIGIIVSPSQFAVERAGDVGTVNYRINLWGAALKMVMAKPLFGHGISRFERLAPDFRMRTGIVPDLVIPKAATGTHNLIFNLLTEQGLFGLVLFGAILAQLFHSAIRGSQVIWPKAGRLWLISFICIYFINAQFINMHEAATNLIFYGTLGLLAGVNSEELKPGVLSGFDCS